MAQRGFARGIVALTAVLAVSGHASLAAVLLPGALAVTWRLGRQRQESDVIRRRRARDAPRAADVVALCLDAGATVPVALRETAVVIGGPVALDLEEAATALSWGADLGDLCAGSALVSALARSAMTGAPAAALLRQLADDQRARRRWELLDGARRAGVQAVAPLAVCFLPAFVLVGIVPVVVGVARSLLSPT